MNFLPEAEFGDEFHPFVTSDKYLGSLTKLLRAQSLLPRAIEGQAILEKAVRLDPGVISRPQ